jgi:hypothetical protein
MTGIGMNIRFIDHGIAGEIEVFTREVVQDFALEIAIAVEELMGSGARSGNIVRHGRFDRRSRVGGLKPSGRGTRIHRPSAPGEPLATDTGGTVRSIKVRQLANGNVRIRFGGGIAFWEFKMPSGLRRPTVVPAIELAAQRTFGR